MRSRVNPYGLLMTTDAIGGVWRYCLDAARALGECGVATTLVTLGPLPSPRQRREASAIAALRLIETELPLDWLDANAETLTRAADKVAAFAREADVDLVQLNGTPLAGLAAFEVPVVAVHHSCLATWHAAVKGGPLPDAWVWRRDLTRGHLTAAACVAAPSRAFAEATAAIYDLPAIPKVIPNGRPAPPHADPRPPIRSLLAAGRLWDEAKDIATLARAAVFIDAPVFACGATEGPNGERACCDGLQALGELSEPAMRAWLAKRPIFVSTARYEPFGLAVLEAAQAGCALLLADIPTFRELWGEAAIFSPPGDAAALARAARSLLDRPAAREALGEAARARSQRYGARAWRETTLSWHCEVLQSRGLPGECAA